MGFEYNASYFILILLFGFQLCPIYTIFMYSSLSHLNDMLFFVLDEKQIEKILQDLLIAVILRGEEPEKAVSEKTYEIQNLKQLDAIKTK